MGKRPGVRRVHGPVSLPPFLLASAKFYRHALTYAAQPYSVARLLAQGWEKLTGEPVTLRFGPGQVICSALIALPYWVELGTRFDGKHWRRCTSDDIGDHVQKSKHWEMASEKTA